MLYVYLNIFPDIMASVVCVVASEFVSFNMKTKDNDHQQFCSYLITMIAFNT